MNRFLGYFVLTFVFAAIVWWSDPFVLRALAFLGAAVGVPVALLATFLLWCASRQGRTRPALVQVLRVLAYAAVLGGVALPLNHQVFQRAIAEAKAWPLVLRPYLEGYRTVHGTYPRRLQDLSSHPPLPRLIGKDGYGSDGRNFTLWFGDPIGGFFDAWVYESSTGQWHFSS
ncbi:hypothetical protein [Prosthecobacter dejongeii]|uniref:Type II secretion system (T2SS), protein G n=1 Tax=Prosthecobacter dejongeii TaxID=48465 RepID=A0A7W7YNJ3_9BACT|nr:hypothetical protein [Prosthecobacter dejongeii]MBB5039337.1 hypothetical protein [Prosthecobacter dejongeii]